MTLLSDVVAASREPRELIRFGPGDRARGKRAIELAEHTVTVARNELTLLVPATADAAADELRPYWAVLWPSAISLAEALAERALAGAHVVELGCGLGLPSIVAALDDADVVATDTDADAVDLLRANAVRNGASLRAERADWSDADHVVALGPFDVVLASDVLYEARAVDLLLELLPRLGAEALLADPGRPYADSFLARATSEWRIEPLPNRVHRLTRRG